MKKRYYWAILFIMITAFSTACTKTDDKKNQTKKTTTEATTKATTTEEPKQYTECVIYTPDEQAETLVSKKVKVQSMDESTVLKELQKIGTLNNKVKILSYEKKNKQIKIDFNEEFAKYFRTMGSAEETLKMQALAKTFCENLDAEKFSFTVKGEVLETGHQIYDEPIGVK